MNTEYEYHAMAHWKKEVVKIIADEPEKHLDYHATILKHAHERGWLEALQWAAGQIVPDGNPEVALEKINREIKRAVEPANDKVSYHADNAGGAHGKDTNDK